MKTFGNSDRIKLGCLLTVIAAGSVVPWNRAVAETSTDATGEAEVEEVIVTGLRGRAATIAPFQASLAATEPQTVITRKFIEESAPRIGDFSTVAIYAPSMAGAPANNGPGLSDGGKIVLRGFADGNYNITYDGIAWGDTNGPSHHGTAFFPSSTIGGVVIERGPGGAPDLGQANFGGSINLFSLPLEDAMSAKQTVTYGSWVTWQGTTTLQSGAIPQLNGAKLVANFQEYTSHGFLSNNFTNGHNQFIKGAVPLTERVTITALYTQNHNFYNKSDVGDASVAQMEQFGKRFSLGDDPKLQSYFGYNTVKKKTDFEYVRVNADLGAGFAVENTLYGYYYKNVSFSAQDNTAPASANLVTLTPGSTYPAPGKTYAATLQTPGIPGYEKRNQYQVAGDIVKGTKDFDFGRLTVGSLFERATTKRFIFDYDLASGRPDYREKAALFAGSSGTIVQTPLNIQYNEYSGWHQVQPFAQFEWKPIDRLTITPGVKYVSFDLYIHAPQLAIPSAIQPFFADQTYTRTLPFLTANYRLSDNWSTYAQYAKGFLVPKIGNLYVSNLQQTRVQPQLSTNYQLGTVWKDDAFVLDADIYYIDFKNKIQAFTDAVTGQSYDTNSGGAAYRGFEAEATYLLPAGFSVFGNYSLNQAKGKNDPSNPLYNGHQLTGAPRWTAAGGVRYGQTQLFNSDDELVLSFIDKWVGQQYVNNAKCPSAPNGVCVSPVSALTPVTGLIQSYGQADFSATYRLGRYSIEAQVLNLFNSQDVVAFKGSALLPGSQLPAQTSAQGGAKNAFQYQPDRNFQITLKAVF
ncbi:TonB-dependent receptor [Roseiterribacter gracilis]|uniref:TonB-dependent receptor n=1 Tax=Roseiterribacter gracilis TaxID=2812848 RepID=A0A8S8X9I1_9PROT|nr:hypothetical protein TMPK1_02140 [Rhodospirillales bacterium TMPK1]